MSSLRRLRILTGILGVFVAAIGVVSQTSSNESLVHADMQAYMAARTTTYGSTDTFSFGVFSDIHMSEDSQAVLTRAQWASLLNNWKTQGNLFDVIVGDLGYGHATDIDNVLSGPAAVPGAPPVFYSMGNHEIDPLGKRTWVDALYPGAIRSTSWTTGPPVAPGNLDHVYWSFNVGSSSHFVMLDADYMTYDTVGRTWQTLGPAQYAWLTADLAANTDRNAFVFVHEPIDQQVTGGTPALTLNDKGGLLDLLSKHPKKTFVFSGHLHSLGGITKWKGVTSVHVNTGLNPNYGVRVSVAGDVVTISGAGTSTVTDFDASPLNQIQLVGGVPVLRVAEDGMFAGNTAYARMTSVAPENGVSPTSGSFMLRADSMTSFSPRFISETTLKIVPGLHLSYDIYLLGVTNGKDAIAVQPSWYNKDDIAPLGVFDQNWIALSRRTRNNMYFGGNEDMPPLGGRATNQWYHRDIDLTQMTDSWVDGIYLTSSFTGANVATIYVDNIRFTWPAPGTTVAGPRMNVALPVNGGSVVASSLYTANYQPSGAVDGDRRGMGWGINGGWADGTANIYPDWLEVDFTGVRTINEVDVFSVQDLYTTPLDPTPTMTFSLYGLRDFEVQYWTGSAWTAVPGGTVSGNSLVWRKFTFAPLATSKIRVWVTNALFSYSRITEVEAWASASASNAAPAVSLTAPTSGAGFAAGTAIALNATATDPDGTVGSVSFYANGGLIGSDPTSPYSVSWTAGGAGSYSLTAVATDNTGATTTSLPVSVTITGTGRTNVAASSAGATATASSIFNTGYSPAGAINGDRIGSGWGTIGGWNDATFASFPDWLEVDFSGTQTINEVDVFSLQDAYTTPIDPTSTTTFSLYGLKDFEVQYWTGATWIPVPGGTIVNNNLVWRQISFAPLSTSRIRLWTTAAANNYSRVVEIEAYASGGNAPPTVSITSPGSGATFSIPASLTVSAAAADSDGTVASVAFYANGALIGSDATSPYSVSWSPVTAGTYSLTAVATDNLASTSTSAPVTMTTTGRINVAASSAGATALASSTFGSGYIPAGAINGDRKGLSWATSGGWNDATFATFPDWLEVDFNGPQTINEIDVFSIQDSYAAPVDPTPTTTFSLYGLKDFEVQYWTGTAWTPVPGGTVTANNLVWRQLTFAPLTTSRIRVWVTAAGNGYSRVAEIEAYVAGSPEPVPAEGPADQRMGDAPAGVMPPAGEPRPGTSPDPASDCSRKLSSTW